MNNLMKDEKRINIAGSSEFDYTTPLFGGNYGWICPKCGRVYSPFTTMCPYCVENNEVSYTSTNIGIKNK